MSDVKRYNVPFGWLFEGLSGSVTEPEYSSVVLHSDYEALERETAELREKLLRVVRGEFGQICSGCGWESPRDGASWEQLQAHILECPNHPIAALLARITSLEREKEELCTIVSDIEREATLCNNHGITLQFVQFALSKCSAMKGTKS